MIFFHEALHERHRHMGKVTGKQEENGICITEWVGVGVLCLEGESVVAGEN